MVLSGIITMSTGLVIGKCRCSNIFHSRKLGVGAANRKLLKVCQNYRPDIIALSSADVIRAETLAVELNPIEGSEDLDLTTIDDQPFEFRIDRVAPDRVES